LKALLKLATTLGRGQPRAILESAEDLLKVSPKDCLGLNVAAQAHLDLEEWEQAERLSKEVLAVEASDFRALQRLVYIAWRRDDPETGYEFARRAVVAMPSQGKERFPPELLVVMNVLGLVFLRPGFGSRARESSEEQERTDQEWLDWAQEFIRRYEGIKRRK
jgi:hypothetical protein